MMASSREIAALLGAEEEEEGQKQVSSKENAAILALLLANRALSLVEDDAFRMPTMPIVE